MYLIYISLKKCITITFSEIKSDKTASYYYNSFFLCYAPTTIYNPLQLNKGVK